jgi:uncharacterized protein (TIGR03435 family)
MSPWIHDAGMLVHFVWQGAVVGLAAAAVLRLLGAASAQTRHAVACGALAELESWRMGGQSTPVDDTRPTSTAALTTAMVLLLIVVAGSRNHLPAQTPASLAFEAASIKPNTSSDSGGGANFQPGGRFVARNATLRGLIRGAFGDPGVQLDPSRMSGGPSWIDTDRFDVQARAATEFSDLTFGGGSTATGAAMLRALLAERFRLATHWDTREIPVYALVRRDATRLGPRLVSSSGTPGTDCLSDGAVASADTALPRCGSYLLQNTGGNQFAIHARGITMTNFARNLQNVAGRVVLDRTALGGPYSFDLDFEYRPPSATSADDGQGAAIFTALQEQLGLKLESTKGPVDVLVIDHVERPTGD